VHYFYRLKYNLPTFHAQDGTAQELLGISIDNSLHETARLADFQGTGHGIHGQFRHTDVASLFSGFVFGYANMSKLGIDENGIGDNAILNASAAILKPIGA
jgi:hypothetical protein